MILYYTFLHKNALTILYSPNFFWGGCGLRLRIWYCKQIEINLDQSYLIELLQWWKWPISVVSSTVAINRMLLLSTWNMANATEELNFILILTYLNLNSYQWLLYSSGPQPFWHQGFWHQFHGRQFHGPGWGCMVWGCIKCITFIVLFISNQVLLLIW